MALRAVKVLVDAENVERLVAFYAAITGMEITHESDDWGELEWQGAAIGLHPGGDAAQEQWTPLSFTVDSLEELGRAVEAAGGEVARAPYDPGEGPFRLATYRDPEKNLFMGREDV